MLNLWPRKIYSPKNVPTREGPRAAGDIRGLFGPTSLHLFGCGTSPTPITSIMAGQNYCKRFCFTIPNPTTVTVSNLDIYLTSPRIEWSYYQLEEGKNGLRHIQGAVYFKTRIRIARVIEQLQGIVRNYIYIDSDSEDALTVEVTPEPEEQVMVQNSNSLQELARF